jgi:hypothetical protein
MGEWRYSSTFLDPCRFIPGEMDPGTHCIGGWVGPRASLTLWSREGSCTDGNITRAVKPVAHRYTDSPISAPIILEVVINILIEDILVRHPI